MSRVRENRTHGSTGGDWKRSTLAMDTKKNDPDGKPPGLNGFVTYRQECHRASPRPYALNDRVVDTLALDVRKCLLSAV